jgi:hypothetical protein
MVLVLTTAFSLVGAQQAEQLTSVEGKVIDGATSLPVAGARVALARVDRPGARISQAFYETEVSTGAQDPKADHMSAVTGDDGAFRFLVEGPAKFVLFADAAGYAKKPFEISRDTPYNVKPGSLKTDIVIRLVRQARISGRVIDADTLQPLANLSVVPQRYRSTSGSRFLIPDGQMKTDREGRFTLDLLLPGDYYLEVRAPLRASIEEPEPVGDFQSVVQKSYASMWYPGVERSEDAALLTLVEGVPIEDVDIKVAKRRTASLRGVILGGEDPVAVSEVTLQLVRTRHGIERRRFSVVARGSLKPGAEFEIDRVFPGTYYLFASANQLSAVMPLEVGEENQDGLVLYLRNGVTLTGRVRIEDREDRADDPALPSEGVRVGLQPMTRTRISSDPGPTVINSRDGSFTFGDVALGSYHVYFAKLPDGYTTSEIRYNGTVCQGNIISLDAAAQKHWLDVKLALASGRVTATVTDGIRPVAGAVVLLVPDPVADDAIDIGFDLRQARADENGRAIISGLLPGAYRIAAYRDHAPWGNDPNLKRRLRAGQELRVGANQMALIEIRAQDSP